MCARLCVCVSAHVALCVKKGEESVQPRKAGRPEEWPCPYPTSAIPGCCGTCVCVYLCVCVHGYHLGRTSGARLDCTASQSTFNLPSALSPRRKVKASARAAPSPRNTNSGGARVCVCARGGHWLSIIDGSWLWWTSSLCLGQRRWPIFHSRSSAELMCCVNACVNQEECSAARPPRS